MSTAKIDKGNGKDFFETLFAVSIATASLLFVKSLEPPSLPSSKTKQGKRGKKTKVPKKR
jgi:hypothetical protein